MFVLFAGVLRNNAAYFYDGGIMLACFYFDLFPTVLFLQFKVTVCGGRGAGVFAPFCDDGCGCGVMQGE
jgi:hypothetical protein